jgi:UDPglucose 6-dehydrogenase
MVTVLDIDSEKLKAFASGRVDIYEPGLSEMVNEGITEKRLEFKQPSEVDKINAPLVMVCVGTPSRADGAADLFQVRAALRWIRDKANGRGPVTVVMKSTVPPGRGELLYNQFLTDLPGRFYYISNPEFLREGQALHDWFYPDRIVIGGRDQMAIEQVRALYNNIDAPVLITDITSAELIKYAANAFLATKISFINEVANLCECIGANIDAVAQGIGFDPRIGSGFLKAGIGYGGSCFPKDVRALDFLSTVNGNSFELLKATIIVNNRQRTWPMHKLRSHLGQLAGKQVAVLGLAFKPGTDDMREAPAIDIIRILMDEGADVRAYDPLAADKAAGLLQNSGLNIKLCRSVKEALAGTQAAVIATEWEEFINFDWVGAKNLMQEPFLIIDGRNCLNPVLFAENGFCYCGVGRGHV